MITKFKTYSPQEVECIPVSEQQGRDAGQCSQPLDLLKGPLQRLRTLQGVHQIS